MHRRWQHTLPRFDLLVTGLALVVALTTLASFVRPRVAMAAPSQPTAESASVRDRPPSAPGKKTPSPAPSPTSSPAPSPTSSPDPSPTSSPDPSPTSSPTSSPTPSPAAGWAPHPLPAGPTAPPPTTEDPRPTPEPNQVLNPGFESVVNGQPLDWTIDAGASAISVVNDDGSGNVHSGGNALRFSSPAAANVSITSNYFEVQSDWMVDATAWFKWQGVTALRMNLYAYDANMTRIKSWEVFNVDGTWLDNWRRMGWLVLAPANTRYMQLRIQFSSSAGTAWMDDVYVRAIPVPQVQADSVPSPNILPLPWRLEAQPNAAPLPVGTTAIIYPDGEERLLAAAQAVWQELGVATQPVPAAQADQLDLTTISTVLRFGDSGDAGLYGTLPTGLQFADFAFLGNEGYYLHVGQDGDGKTHIIVGANSEHGRFYALQTIRQTTEGTGPGSAQSTPLDVVDVNTVARRGQIMGSYHFNTHGGGYLADLQELARYKMNYIWNQGSFINDKFRYAWRTPFTEAEKQILQTYLQASDSLFVTPWLSIGPRAAKDGKDSTCYSCESDINAVVAKMDALYGLGLRHFGMNFDDLWNVGQAGLSAREDLRRFGSVAEAHVYFVNQIYTRLKGLHPEIRFMMLPMYCYLTGDHGATEQDYMAGLAALDPEIEISSVQYYDADYLMTTQSTGKGNTTWSNYYAEGYTPTRPDEHIVPHYNLFNWWTPGVAPAVLGLSFLPFDANDTTGVMYATSGDYFWAPDRYDPQRAWQMRMAQYGAGW